MTKKSDHHKHHRSYRWWLIVSLSIIIFLLLGMRAYELQVLHRQFLSSQGEARQQRVVEVVAHRGVITDRHGEPLAISTPVDSIWVNPRQFVQQPESISILASELNLSKSVLKKKITEQQAREFLYIKRQLTPARAKEILELGLPGVFSQREYRRYYPGAEVTSHLLGFTNIDDHGQEGIELAYNNWLLGQSGRKRVVQDRLGRVIEDLESIEPAKPGRDLTLSIDKRLQYLAYRELKSAVKKHRAASGSVIMMSAKSGEILAMVNQPTFNPHNRAKFSGNSYRNRAVTDVFEPGSTIKPFIVAAALENSVAKPTTVINTQPGFLKIADYTIKDNRNYGSIDIKDIIRFSSNVGASKLALKMPADKIWQSYSRFGFGVSTGSGFPGESTGYLSDSDSWTEVDQASLAYGYGISATALQLASAYSVIANNGLAFPLSFVQHKPQKPLRVLQEHNANALKAMLRSVVSDTGTGHRADVTGYQIAGKTGTVRKSTREGYSEKDYVALFAGFAPVSDPQLVVVVVIQEPKGDLYYGGHVAAPVFANIMEATLRMLNIPPDDPEALYAKTIGVNHDA